MAVEPIKQSKGVSRAKVACDFCDRSEVVACGYSRPTKHSPTEPNQSQARARVMGMGWTYIKGKLRCPACEAKRKVVPMTMKAKEKVEPIREPSRAQKRQIMDMLDAVYDTDAERYMQGDTDDTVAEVLKVMPGWVSQLREEFFGPDGGNENIEELMQRLTTLEKDCNAIINSAAQQHDAATKKLAEVSAAKADLEKIKAQVGPRNLKAAGVK